jgi:hypothetical protein
MSCNSRTLLLALIGVCASTVLASAQATSSQTETNSSSPVAFVYVSNSPSSGTGQINGYTAAANGALTPITGSPFPHNVNYMAVNGAYLFANENNENASQIDSYSIASNGTLTLREIKMVESNPALFSIYLDHTGSTLYADYYTTNNDYLQYTINQSNGELNFLGDLPGGPSNNSPVSFIGNNVYAYSSSCYQFTPQIIGVQRASDGALSYISNFSPPIPAAETSGGFYCPWLAAADPTDHVAIAMQAVDSNWVPTGPYQLATYTVDSSTGAMTTTSTYSNMPTTQAGGKAGSNASYVIDYWMNPAGNLLAVAGTNGLQVFHFNGANPITKYTKLLTTSEVDQVYWDNNNHLYALGVKAGKLWVFTVNPVEVTEAPGSPYSIPSPYNLIVQPK